MTLQEQADMERQIREAYIRGMQDAAALILRHAKRQLPQSASPVHYLDGDAFPYDYADDPDKSRPPV